MSPPCAVSEREIFNAENDGVRSGNDKGEKKLEKERFGPREKRQEQDSENKGERSRYIEDGPAIENNGKGDIQRAPFPRPVAQKPQSKEENESCLKR